MDARKLASLFSKLVAPSPGDWAKSQVEEGIPQLARFLFLRQAWKLILAPDDEDWIEDARKEAHENPDQPGAEIGPALDRLLANGVSPADITRLVRVMQWRLLADLCYLLDDPGELEAEVSDIAWRLFQVDGDDQPLAILSGLHESVLETDPTGSEMRSGRG